MLNFISDDMRRNPYPLYAQMRSVSPVLALPGGAITDAVLCLLDHPPRRLA